MFGEGNEKNNGIPLVKGVRGMFRPYGIACSMEHPPGPLRKGEKVYYFKCSIK